MISIPVTSLYLIIVSCISAFVVGRLTNTKPKCPYCKSRKCSGDWKTCRGHECDNDIRFMNAAIVPSGIRFDADFDADFIYTSEGKITKSPHGYGTQIVHSSVLEQNRINYDELKDRHETDVDNLTKDILRLQNHITSLTQDNEAQRNEIEALKTNAALASKLASKSYKAKCDQLQAFEGILLDNQRASGDRISELEKRLSCERELVAAKNAQLNDLEQQLAAREVIKYGREVFTDGDDEPGCAWGESKPSCPECGDEMQVKVAKRGKHEGKRFWGCKSFPNCYGLVPIERQKA